MSPKRTLAPLQESKPGAPKYIVSYAAMMTILLAFFIMMNNLATVREYGLVGAGLGVFRESFNAHGLPGILPGSLRARKLAAECGKFVPQDVPENVEGRTPDERLIEPPEQDLEEVLNALVRVEPEVGLPVPLEDPDRLDQRARERLSAIAAMVRSRPHQIHVQALLRGPTEPSREEWRRASASAYRVADYLCRHERIAQERLLVVSRAEPRDRTDRKEGASADIEIRLVLRSPVGASGTPLAGDTLVPPAEQRTLFRMTR